MRYLITFDLKAHRPYDELFDVLNGMHAMYVMNSVWLVRRTNSSTEEICDLLRTHLHWPDRLLVTELADGSATVNLTGVLERV